MKIPKRTQQMLLALTIALTCLIYIPNLGNSFSGLDARSYSKVLDSKHFCETSQLLFLDFAGKVVPGYYAPLGSISLMADKWLIGSNVPVPRFTLFMNLMIHCLNGMLIYFLLESLEIDFVLRIITVLFFLIHPIQVSSVLWFAERKTMMSLTFYLVAYISFTRFKREGRRLNYGISLVAFTAGLLTKPTVCVLPVVLLLTDVLWVFPDQSPRGVGKFSSFAPHVAPVGERPVLKEANGRPLLEKLLVVLPFFLIALIFSLVSIKSEGASYAGFPLLRRVFIAASAIWFYIWKTLLPTGMTFIYPRWHVEPSSFWWWIPLIALTGCAVLLFWLRRHLSRYVIWGLVNFIVPLSPAIGLVPFGYQQHSFVANHFMYISMIGASFLLALPVAYLIKFVQRPIGKVSLAAALCYFAFIVFQTWHQVKIWESPMILWQDNWRKNPVSYAVQFALGTELMVAGKLQDAMMHLSKSIDLKPDNADAYNNLGETLMRLGKIKEAMRSFRKAIKLRPGLVNSYNNLGNAFLSLGNYEEAIKLFSRGISLEPSQHQPYMNRGTAYMNLGKIPQAIKDFQTAVQMDPQSAKSHANLGFALLAAGRPSASLAHLRKAIEIDPGLALAHNAIGSIYMNVGAFDEAARHFQKALEIQPDLKEARENLRRLNERLSIIDSEPITSPRR
ncbi:MAG: tetratricopeptide repeat protein [Desulfomonilaceae bacterium]